MLKKHPGKILPTFCVYGIRNSSTNQIYVSSSTSTGKAFKQETAFLKRGTHQCQALQNDYAQVGADAFVFEVLQSVNSPKADNLPVLQQKWMQKLLDEGVSLYNAQDLAEDLKLDRTAPKIYTQPKRSNPSPVRTTAVKQNEFKAVSELPPEPLAKKDVYVKVGQSVYEYLYSLPQRDRINLMRSAITDSVMEHQKREC